MLIRYVVLALVLISSLSTAIAQPRDYPRYKLEGFSEESRINLCGAGYVIAGLECWGKYCDDKTIICASVREAAVIPGFAALADRNWSRSISEETGGSNRNFLQYDFRDQLINGLQCVGPYCDNISMHYVKSPHLEGPESKNEDCYWPMSFSDSDRRNFAECRLGDFMVGMKCEGKYCNRITIECCRFYPTGR